MLCVGHSSNAVTHTSWQQYSNSILLLRKPDEGSLYGQLTQSLATIHAQ